MTKKKAVEIVVDPGNARVHDERNQQVIQESLRELGAGRSIVIDKAGQVIAGNETYRQAKALGLPVKIVESDGQTLIVVQRKDLAPEDERRRALAIADNRSSDLSEFDMGILVNTLKAAGPELRDAMGFTEKELAQVFRQAQPKDLKDPPAPPAPEEPRAKPGQLFALGPHRLLCGDATKQEDVGRLMGGEKADMVFTDPPYGIAYSSAKYDGNRAGVTNKRNDAKMIPGDGKDFDPSFICDTFHAVREIFIWGFQYYPDKLGRGGIIVWNKKQETEANCPHGDFELCWSKQERNKMCWLKWGGFNNKEQGEERLHTTQKPLALVAWFFDHWGKEREIVVDLFGGSGSTLLAADQLERECRMMEIDPGYCDVIIQRYCALKEIDPETVYGTAMLEGVTN